MVERSMAGVLVPVVKMEPPQPPSQPLIQMPEEEEEADKDTLCPICMEMIKEAFLTVCGHSFCYMCIFTHLRNKSDCPCCGFFLTNKHIFPNMLLNKLLKKTSASQIEKISSPAENLRRALEEGCKVSVKEIDGLLSLLLEKKIKEEQQEVESNTRILYDFLHFLKKQKLEELNEIQSDLQSVKEDINAVERQRMKLYRGREKCFVKIRTMIHDPTAAEPSSLIDKHSIGIISSARDAQFYTGSFNTRNKKTNEEAHVSPQELRIRDGHGRSDSQYVTQLGLPTARKRRVQSQFNDLQDYYLQKRRHWTRKLHKQVERDRCATSRKSYNPALKDFQSVLITSTQYSQLRAIAEPRHGDLFQAANVVSSIEFDGDNQLFATAGVSRRVKIFEFSPVVNEPTEVHYPIVEMPTRAKLSCLSWGSKNHIASSDYEGIVTVWDVATGQSVMEYEEHEKRAWSVDFSCTEASMLVSGSDDFKVKIWCLKQEASALNIDMKANICSVKYNPGSSIHVAVGSADHHIHYYDLRNVRRPLYVFSGHEKTVSYVKFLSNNELASASIDSTLRLWDVKENLPLRTFRGHMNEKNFVGLSVNSEFIACGSETNEVFVYHKAISRPVASHRFDSDVDDGNDDVTRHFISAVCWKGDSPTMISANSQGTIRVLALAS